MQYANQLAPDVVKGGVVDAKDSLNPAIGDAAFGDEAPEYLFQDLLKVHVSRSSSLLPGGRYRA